MISAGEIDQRPNDEKWNLMPRWTVRTNDISMERKMLDLFFIKVRSSKSGVVTILENWGKMSCIMFFSKMFVFWQKMPLQSIQLNYKNRICVLTRTASLKLYYVKYLNKTSYLRKNDVFYVKTRIMVISMTLFTLLEWPWHWRVVHFHQVH